MKKKEKKFKELTNEEIAKRIFPKKVIEAVKKAVNEKEKKKPS